jgi:hypothetical protein
MAGVTRSAANCARRAGCVPFRQRIQRQADRRKPARHLADRQGTIGLGDPVGGARPAAALPRDRCDEAGSANKHRQRRRNAERVRQSKPMQGGPHHRHIAEFGIAEDRRDVEPRGAHLAHQRQRMAPFLLKPDRGRDPCLSSAFGRQPRLRQIQRGPEKPPADSGPEGHRRGHLAIRDLAQRAAVLTRRADRMGALFGKAGPVEDQDAAALGNHRPQAAPHPLGIPRRVRDEMLKGLIGDRLGDASQHRLHRFPLAVAEDALDVCPQRHQLRTVPKAALELLEPSHQPLDARRRGVVDHRAAPYQTRVKCTMSSIQITCETRTNQAI